MFAAALFAGLIATPLPVIAAGQGIVATVNDQPITQLDIDQRLKLLKILGDRGESRKQALTGLINEKVQISEAKKYKLNASDAQISKQMEKIAKALGTDAAGSSRSSASKASGYLRCANTSRRRFLSPGFSARSIR